MSLLLQNCEFKLHVRRQCAAANASRARAKLAAEAGNFHKEMNQSSNSVLFPCLKGLDT